MDTGPAQRQLCGPGGHVPHRHRILQQEVRSAPTPTPTPAPAPTPEPLPLPLSHTYQARASSSTGSSRNLLPCTTEKTETAVP